MHDDINIGNQNTDVPASNENTNSDNQNQYVASNHVASINLTERESGSDAQKSVNVEDFDSGSVRAGNESSIYDSEAGRDTFIGSMDDVIAYPEEDEIPKIDFIDEDEDYMDNYIWDGPDNSDEEIESMLPFKNEWETQKGVKFSKNGLIEFIDKFLKEESTEFQKAWEKKLDAPAIKYYLKKGGSDQNASQPFFRSETNFNKVFKMNKLAKCVSNLC